MRWCVAVVGIVLAIAAACTSSDDDPDPELLGTWTRVDAREELEVGYRITYHPDGNFDIVRTSGSVTGGTWRRTAEDRVERCTAPDQCADHAIAVDGDLMLGESDVMWRVGDPARTDPGLAGTAWTGQHCWNEYGQTACETTDVELNADGTARYTRTLTDPNAPRESWSGTWTATPLGAGVTSVSVIQVRDYVHVGERLGAVGFRRTVDLR